MSKPDSQILGVKASGVTINYRPDGVIEIYISQKRYDWQSRPIGRNYEVITIAPKTEAIKIAQTETLIGGEI